MPRGWRQRRCGRLCPGRQPVRPDATVTCHGQLPRAAAGRTRWPHPWESSSGPLRSMLVVPSSRRSTPGLSTLTRFTFRVEDRCSRCPRALGDCRIKPDRVQGQRAGARRHRPVNVPRSWSSVADRGTSRSRPGHPGNDDGVPAGGDPAHCLPTWNPHRAPAWGIAASVVVDQACRGRVDHDRAESPYAGQQLQGPAPQLAESPY